jgi:hypothetical protein
MSWFVPNRLYFTYIHVLNFYSRALAEALGIYRPDTPEVVQYPHFLEEHGRYVLFCNVIYFEYDNDSTITPF